MAVQDVSIREDLHFHPADLTRLWRYASRLNSADVFLRGVTTLVFSRLNPYYPSLPTKYERWYIIIWSRIRRPPLSASLPTFCAKILEVINREDLG